MGADALVQFLTYFDYVCVAFLGLEVVIGIVALGFVQSEGSISRAVLLDCFWALKLTTRKDHTSNG